MRKIVKTDRHGYRRAWLIRDDDPDETAEQYGVPLAPPDVEKLDWEEIKRDLHNALIDRGLYTWQDVQKAQNALGGIAQSVLRRRLVLLYRQEHQEVADA